MSFQVLLSYRALINNLKCVPEDAKGTTFYNPLKSTQRPLFGVLFSLGMHLSLFGLVSICGDHSFFNWRAPFVILLLHNIYIMRHQNF